MKRRKFSELFKRELVRKIQAKEISASRAAKENNLSAGLLYVWRKKYDSVGPVTAVRAPTSEASSELRVKGRHSEVFEAIDDLIDQYIRERLTERLRRSSRLAKSA